MLVAIGRRPPRELVLAWVENDVVLLHLRSGRITHAKYESFLKDYHLVSDVRDAYKRLK